MEIAKEYAIAFTQVLQIIKMLKPQEFNRIPKEVINTLEKNKDNSYEFNYKHLEPLDSQLTIEARGILTNLFRKYIATEEDRKKINEKYKGIIYKQEIEKSKNIKSIPLFKDNEKIIKNATVDNQYSLVEMKKKNIFIKIRERIKKMFRR